MMMKMKGIAPSSSNMRFKHQSLMQDFYELQRETQAMRERLDGMKKKKLTLKAEVRFLRRRHKYLMQNQSLNPPPEKGLLPPQLEKPRERKIVKGLGKNYGGKSTFLRQQASVSDSKKKVSFLSNGKEVGFRPPVPVFDLNQKGRNHGGNEAMVRGVAPVLDLNQTERVNALKGAHNVTPAFDLNQVSMEEEELQANYEPLTSEELRTSSVRGGSDEQLREMKLSICRNTGDGSSRAGKRKISWRDHVALRV